MVKIGYTLGYIAYLDEEHAAVLVQKADANEHVSLYVSSSDQPGP